jgi:DNA-binding NarL/FixJ family response regulator
VDIADGGGMVGRAAELARLDELLTGLADGRGGLAWVQGEPGVGKSTLIDATVARFPRRDGAIFRAAGEPLMRPFPLRLMADCLGVSATAPDAAARQIAGLLRGEPGGYAALDPVLAAAEKMLELADRLCARGPVILVAEDLQWSDEPSLLVWSRLARAVDQIPLLLIGAARPLPRRTQLDQIRALVTERAGVVIDLAPLAAGDAAALAGLIAGGEPGPRLRSALGRAAGNPLYLRELVDALVRDGLIAVGRDSRSTQPPGAQPPTAELLGDVTATPASLRVAIGSRLGFMSAPTLQAVQMAALLGHEFDLGELAAATGQRVSRLAEVLADAIAGGVLSGSGEELRFRHGLIHQILLDQTPEALRRPLHAEIARLLAAAGRPVDSVARHLLAVPGSMEPWAVEWLATTAEPALLALSEVSAELLEQAIEAGGQDGEHGEALGARLAEVLFWLGRDEAAAEVAAGVAARTGDEIRAARLRIIVMRAAGRLGRAQDGLAVALRSPGDDALPPMWRARIGAWSAQLWLLAGDRQRAGQGAAAALDQATASGDALSIAFARYACALCGPPAEGPAQIAAALAVLPGTDPESVDLRILLLVSQLVQSAYHGRLAGSRAAIAEVLALADQAGGFRAAAIRATAAGFCYRYGLWDEALVQEAGIDPEHLSSATLTPQHGLVATIALRRGDTAAADAHLRAALERLPETTADPPLPVSPLTEALARRAEADGDLPRAVSIMSAWLSAAPGIGRYDRHDDLPYLVRLALSAGDTATARAAAATAEADAVADRSSSRVAAAAFCRALLADDADALLALAEEYRGYGWIPHMTAALEEAAVCLAGAGQAAAARAALTDAVRTYADLGATWDIRRADARLRAHGIRRGPRSAHRRATTGWAALTPSEANIARMVADGLSNPDIAAELYLSRRTVQTHVSNILTKLQARSRIDIIRTAQRQPPAPTTRPRPAAEQARRAAVLR